MAQSHEGCATSVPELVGALCRTGLSTFAQEPWHYTVLEGSTSVSGISMVPINP